MPNKPFKLSRRQAKLLSAELAALAVTRMLKRALPYLQLDRPDLPEVSAEAKAKFRRVFTGKAKP